MLCNSHTLTYLSLQFSQSAKTIKDAARFYSRNGMSSLLTLGDTIASEAAARSETLDLNETWPFVSVYDFEIKGAHTRLDSATELVIFAPMVSDENRERWEEYSVDNQGWLMKSTEQALQTNTWFEDEFYDEIGADEHEDGAMDHDNTAMNHGATGAGTMDHGRNMRAGRRFLQDVESMDMTGMVMEMNGTSLGTMDSSMGASNVTAIASEIYRMEADGSTNQESRAFYAPVWQMSPPPKEPSLVNQDLYSNPVFKRMINYIMDSGGQPGLSEFVDVRPLYEGLFTEAEHWQLHDKFHGAGANVGHSARDHPHTLIVAPVRRTIDTDAEIVGILAAVVPWDLYLSRLLPLGIDGVYVVLENTCGQVVTYEINGPEASFIGKGDLHQTTYDRLKQSYRLSEVITATRNSVTEDSLQCGKIFGASDEYDASDRNSPSHSPVLPLQNTQFTCTHQLNSGKCTTLRGPKRSPVSLLPCSLRLEWSSSFTFNTFQEDKTKS
jgi:hypothetical protein